MNKHTAGPWEIKKLDANHSVVFDADGMVVCGRLITEPGTGTEANGRLIAAAPDLLAALQSIAAWLVAPATNESTIEEMRNMAGAAITKAVQS